MALGSMGKAIKANEAELKETKRQQKLKKAEKAIELSMALLGDVGEKTLEAQSKCFMQMRMDSLDESLGRWASYGTSGETVTVKDVRKKQKKRAGEKAVENYVKAFGSRLLDIGDDD